MLEHPRVHSAQWEAGKAAAASGIEWMGIFLTPESLHLSLKGRGDQRQHQQHPKDKDPHTFGFSKNTFLLLLLERARVWNT